VVGVALQVASHHHIFPPHHCTAAPPHHRPQLDSVLEGQLVWLTFDGVFRAADIYLNGALIGHHEEG
jgi:hypothetical protein